MTRELIFVDAETSGLSSVEDDLVELTWAPLVGEPETLWFGVEAVPDFIDDLIGFTKRGIGGRISDEFAFQRFFAASDDATMVAANPGFDASFLKEAGLFHFHYRMLDIESYAMAKLGLDYMPGMKNIQELLNERGYEITVPDHTSRNDVLALRDAYQILRRLR